MYVYIGYVLNIISPFSEEKFLLFLLPWKLVLLWPGISADPAQALASGEVGEVCSVWAQDLCRDAGRLPKEHQVSFHLLVVEKQSAVLHLKISSVSKRTLCLYQYKWKSESNRWYTLFRSLEVCLCYLHSTLLVTMVTGDKIMDVFFSLKKNFITLIFVRSTVSSCFVTPLC